MDSEEEPSMTYNEGKSMADETTATLTSRRNGRNIKRQKKEEKGELIMPPSPPTFVTMRQLTEAANAFYNMSLAHEITVDSDFRIEKYDPPEDSFEHTVKETMHRAFWDLLRSSLEADPPDYQPAMRLLTEIKQSLSGLVLPNQKTLHKLIDNSLDLEQAKMQLEQTGHLSLETYAIQVINVMRQFCAPVRDQEVEDLRKIDDPVEAFRNAFILLEKMHMDLANFTITQMRPYIRQQAVNYERCKFTDFLDAQRAIGIDGLRHTREWIRAAYGRLVSESDSVHPISSASSVVSGSNTRPTTMVNSDWANSDEEILVTPNNILREAYLSLLTWPRDKDWPETVIMDQQRLVELGNQLENIITLTSLVLVVCNFVASNASQIFAQSFRVAIDPTTMLELKRLVCQAGIMVFRSAELASPVERATALGDEIICTVVRWIRSVVSLNHIVKRHPSTILIQNPQFDCSDGYQELPDNLKNTLTAQVSEIVHGRHPVYKLMNKRALGFLRLALSSRPPEPLPLPPGFSILLDVRSPIDGTQPGTSAMPPMMTGLSSAGSPTVLSEDASLKRLQKTEHLSLSNLASRILPLLAHNRHVFGPKYAEIIQAILVPLHTPVDTGATTSLQDTEVQSAFNTENTEEEQD